MLVAFSIQPLTLWAWSQAKAKRWLVQWLRLALSKGPNWLGVPPPRPVDGNRSSFRYVVFSNFLEYWTMDKVQKRRNSECYTPSSELFRIYSWLEEVNMSNFLCQFVHKNVILQKLQHLKPVLAPHCGSIYIYIYIYIYTVQDLHFCGVESSF
jgi:hypothetical protein